MSEIELFQALLDELSEVRSILYSAALWVVFALFWIGGKR